MFDLPLHPLVVHMPMALAVIVPVAAILVLLISWKDGVPWRHWLIVSSLAAMLAGSAFVALETGENDEEIAERVVPEAAIEAHEEAAETFLIASGLLFLLSLGAFAPKNERVRRGLAVGTAVAAVGVLALGVDVGHKGGELVYRHGAAAAHAGGSVAPTGGGLASEHDDDD